MLIVSFDESDFFLVRVGLIITAFLLYISGGLTVSVRLYVHCIHIILYTCNVTSIMLCIHAQTVHLY